MQEIYIKPYKTNKVQGRRQILVKDIAAISAPPKLKHVVEEVCLLKPQVTKETHYMISIISIINAIHETVPDVSVQNVGEMDVVVDYNPIKPKPRPIWEWIKVIGICFIIFAGATVAIMAYQTDVSMATTFTTLYEIFTGEVDKSPLWITIPYAIGMPLGVMVFYNHFGMKKLTEDPTPIEVEICTYEKQVDDTIIDIITAEKRGQYEE